MTIVRGDVRDQVVLERSLGEYEIDTVFHLAAQTIVGVANRNPVSTLDTNIRGTWALLEAARRSPLTKAVIIASSDKAYGDHEKLPYDEGAALQGEHPYDVSKSCADLIAKMYAVTFGVPVAITRCGNFYGGGDLNWNRLIPGTIRSALKNERPVIRSDGTLIRDYFYVEDGAGAYMQLAEALHARPELRGEAFNFSNELQVDVLTLATKILERMKSPLQPDVRATRSSISGSAPRKRGACSDGRRSSRSTRDSTARLRGIGNSADGNTRSGPRRRPRSHAIALDGAERFAPVAHWCDGIRRHAPARVGQACARASRRRCASHRPGAASWPLARPPSVDEGRIVARRRSG